MKSKSKAQSKKYYGENDKFVRSRKINSKSRYPLGEDQGKLCEGLAYQK